jgi:uncharacterized protein (TIGR02453 family)
MFRFLKERKTKMAETGFMLHFLKELSENNNRPWFEASKPAYLQAKTSAENLIDSCISALAKHFPLPDLKAKQCMFRIYRDVRFSKNKDPFKKNFSALISANGKKAGNAPSWYLHLEPGGSFLASGVYEPAPEQLAAIRQEIEYNPEEFRAILASTELQKRFGALQGNQLKTAPKNYPKDHPDIDLLRYTQFYLMADYSDDELAASDFPQKFAKDCLLLQDFQAFLKRALD